MEKLKALLAIVDLPVTVWGVVGMGLVYLLLRLARGRPALPSGSPGLVQPDWPVLGSWRFFSDRFNFLMEAKRASKNGNSSFWFGDHHVISVSGAEARKSYYQSKGLDFGDGYAVLFTGAPIPGKVDDDKEPIGKWMVRHFIILLKPENLSQRVPHLSRIAKTGLETAAPRPGEEKVMDPFDVLYHQIYRLTMRTLGIMEIVDSPELLRKTLSWYELIHDGSSPARIVFPWLPTPAWLSKTWAGIRFYTLVSSILKERKRTGRREDDALQYLIDNDDDDPIRVVSFVVGALFAGQTNSGVSVGYLLAFLALTPEWYKRVQDEVDETIRKHRKSPDQSASDVLASLSLTEWEHGFTSIEIASRETIRLHLVGAGFRRNISGVDIPIGKTGEVIPPGSFATHHLDELHMDPEYYPEPDRWNPSRFLSEMEGKAEPVPFLGWGTGRHPCIGMKFAKLEMYILVSMFISMFDFSVEDEQGKPLTTLPINRNNHGSSFPDTPVLLRYKLRESKA